MSFTTNVKNEIINQEYTTPELISELSAIINISGEIESDSFSVYTENLSVSRRIYNLIKLLYNVPITIKTQELNRLNKNYMAIIEVTDIDKNILKSLDIVRDNNIRNYVPGTFILDSIEEKYAYLRGVFLICGSVNDPKTSRYHLEFMIENESTAYFVNDLLNSLQFNSRVLKREKHYMVYLKESEKISDFIKLLKANNSLFYYEDIRIYRDHKNMTNRLNNCEQANIDKIVFSSNLQLENINKLKSMYDFDLLDDKIKEICIYKEKYPESSMGELAEIISLETGKKISKSGVNHRFRKIKEMVSDK